MLSALSTALTAMNAETAAIDVTGNNLANLNTTGYKSSSVVFDDLMSQSLDAEGRTQVGIGVQTPTTQRVFTQGTIQASSSPTDVAIQGNGFLVVQTPSGQTEYTRAGNLQIAANGNLQTATGETVQGWNSVNGALNTTGGLTGITVPTGALKPATATTQLSMIANLNQASAVVTTPSASNVTYSTSVQVYDTLGQSHEATFDYWNMGGGKWQYTSVLDGGKIPTPDPNKGTLQFSSSGALTTVNGTAVTTDPAGDITGGATNPTLSFKGLPDGASDMSITYSLFTSATSAGTTTYTPTVTQFAQTSAVSSNSQDGNGAVQLSSVAIGNGGSVLATYSDGEQIQVGQLAMANFVNPGSLLAVGNNNYQASGLSSTAAIGLPNSGGRGQILGSSLESSTVDIATEFTHLMTYQNSYEAASRIITTGNTMLQQTINLIQG
jgi:flagellar hook protein FlgE